MSYSPTIREELTRLRYEDRLNEARKEQLAAQAAATGEHPGTPRRTSGVGAARHVAAFFSRRHRRALRRLAAS